MGVPGVTGIEDGRNTASRRVLQLWILCDQTTELHLIAASDGLEQLFLLHGFKWYQRALYRLKKWPKKSGRATRRKSSFPTRARVRVLFGPRIADWLPHPEVGIDLDLTEV